jgi:peroxiredoxin
MIKKLFFLLTVVFALSSFHAPNRYQPGDEAIDFNLKNIDNKQITLADYKNAKGFIVVFTCNHCPYSVKYEDRIIALDKKYKAKGYPVIAINPNDALQYPEDDFAGMKQRAKKKKFTFPYLHDESQQIARTYGATKTPDVFLLQKENGKLIVKYTGAVDNDTDGEAVTEKYVEMAVDALLSGNEISITTSKSVGCTIKWKK